MAKPHTRLTLLFLPGAHWGEPPSYEMLVDRMLMADDAVRLAFDDAYWIYSPGDDYTPFSEDPPRWPGGPMLVLTRTDPDRPDLQGFHSPEREKGAFLLLSADGTPALACRRVWGGFPHTRQGIDQYGNPQADQSLWVTEWWIGMLVPVHAWGDTPGPPPH
jgi:hypothetical protein